MKRLFQQHKLFLIPFVELFSKAISFANVLLLMAILPIEEYADYSYIIAIVLWASVLMDGGINSLIYNKSLKREKRGINELYSGRFFLSIAVTVVIVLFFYIKNQQLVLAAFLFSFITYFSSTSALVKMLSRGFGFTNVDLITIVTEPILRLITLVVVFYFRETIVLNLNIILLLYLLAGIAAFLINKQHVVKRFNLKLIGLKLSNTISLIGVSLKQSKYYMLYYLMFIGLARIDVIFIESMTTKVNLGTYSSAFQIYQVAQLFFFSVITSQFLKLNSNKGLIFKAILPLTIIAVITTLFLSQYIYEYLFKQEYNNGQFVLDFLIIALIPSVLNYFYIAKNNYENKVKINFKLILFIFILKLVTYFIISSSDIIFYTYGVIVSEVMLLLAFISYHYLYENTSN